MQKSPEIDDNLPGDKTRTRRGRDGFRPDEMQGQGSARRQERSLIYAPQIGFQPTYEGLKPEARGKRLGVLLLFPAYLRGIETGNSIELVGAAGKVSSLPTRD